MEIMSQKQFSTIWKLKFLGCKQSSPHVIIPINGGFEYALF